MKSKLLLLLISFVFLSGCSLFQPEVVTKTQISYSKVVCPKIPSPVAVTMLPVKPRAITDQEGVVWVGLTPQHYEHLGVNLQDMIRYIKGQKGQVSYYRECINTFNMEIERLQNPERTND